MSRLEDIPDEDTRDVSEDDRDKDPYNNALVLRLIDGQVFRGMVVNIEEGVITKDRLYRIKYEDGEYEHFTPEMMKKFVAIARPSNKKRSAKRKEADKLAKRHEDTRDVLENDRDKDPYNNAFILRPIDGQVFRGMVVNIEEGVITKDRLYRIKYEDGEYEHFTPEMMKKFVARPVPKERKRTSLRRDRTQT